MLVVENSYMGKVLNRLKPFLLCDEKGSTNVHFSAAKVLTSNEIIHLRIKAATLGAAQQDAMKE